MRIDETKTAAGRRTIPLPKFAVLVLSAARASVPRRAGDDLPVDGGHMARPRQLPRPLAEVRDHLGVPDVTSHSFRKTVATLIDDEGLSARIGADHLGHAGCPRRRTPTWLAGGFTRRLLSCWTAP